MKWNIKTILKELAIGAVLLFVVANVMSYVRKPNLDNTQLPQMNMQLLDGATYSVQQNKPLVIHFWATWCSTCKLEASNIESISHDYNVLTFAVNSGDKEKIQAYMRERSLSFNVVNDSDGRWAKKFKVEAYPTTFIYDAIGELKFTEVGYTSTAGLLARLKLSQ